MMATTYGIKNPYLLHLLQQQPVKAHSQGWSNMAHALLAGLEQGSLDRLAAEERAAARQDKELANRLATQRMDLEERKFGLDARKLGLEHDSITEQARIAGGQPPMSPRVTPEPAGPEGPHVPMTPPPGRASLPPVQQATEGIVSAIPMTGPNAGTDIAPAMHAAAAAPAQKVAQAAPTPLPPIIQQMLASPNPVTQKRGVEEAAKFREDERKFRDAVALEDAKERGKMDRAKEAARPGQQQAANVVIQDIDRALDIAKDSSVSGFWGSVSKWVAGSPSHDVDKLLTTVKANVGFQQLQEMRNASPTGGALGQVTLPEIQFLQAAVGNLEQSQSQPQFERNLRRVRQIFTNIQEGRTAFDNGTGSTAGKSNRIRLDVEGNIIQ